MKQYGDRWRHRHPHAKLQYRDPLSFSAEYTGCLHALDGKPVNWFSLLAGEHALDSHPASGQNITSLKDCIPRSPDGRREPMYWRYYPGTGQQAETVQSSIEDLSQMGVWT
jgi:hypothetical protein